MLMLSPFFKTGFILAMFTFLHKQRRYQAVKMLLAVDTQWTAQHRYLHCTPQPQQAIQMTQQGGRCNSSQVWITVLWSARSPSS